MTGKTTVRNRSGTQKRHALAKEPGHSRRNCDHRGPTGDRLHDQVRLVDLNADVGFQNGGHEVPKGYGPFAGAKHVAVTSRGNGCMAELPSIRADKDLHGVPRPIGRREDLEGLRFASISACFRVSQVFKVLNTVRGKPRAQMTLQEEAFRSSYFRYRSEPESVLKLRMLAQPVP